MVDHDAVVGVALTSTLSRSSGELLSFIEQAVQSVRTPPVFCGVSLLVLLSLWPSPEVAQGSKTFRIAWVLAPGSSLQRLRCPPPGYRPHRKYDICSDLLCKASVNPFKGGVCYVTGQIIPKHTESVCNDFGAHNKNPRILHSMVDTTPSGEQARASKNMWRASGGRRPHHLFSFVDDCACPD